MSMRLTIGPSSVSVAKFSLTWPCVPAVLFVRTCGRGLDTLIEALLPMNLLEMAGDVPEFETSPNPDDAFVRLLFAISLGLTSIWLLLERIFVSASRTRPPDLNPTG